MQRHFDISLLLQKSYNYIYIYHKKTFFDENMFIKQYSASLLFLIKKYLNDKPFF